jgi:hypothetical protein
MKKKTSGQSSKANFSNTEKKKYKKPVPKEGWEKYHPHKDPKFQKEVNKRFGIFWKDGYMWMPHAMEGEKIWKFVMLEEKYWVKNTGLTHRQRVNRRKKLKCISNEI